MRGILVSTLRWPLPGANSLRLAGLSLLVLALHVWVLHWFLAHRTPVLPAPAALRWTLHAPATTAPATTAPQPEAGAPSAEQRQPLASTAPARVPRARATELRSEVSAAPTLVQLPASVALKFTVQARVRGQMTEGQATWVWRHDAEHYEARSEVTGLPAGPRVQSSVGAIGPEGLRPERYSDKQRNERAAHFERDQGQVVFSVNRPAATLAEGMQDRLSVVFQLSAMLAAAPARFTPGTEVVVPVVGPREASRWSFTVTTDEVLELAQTQVQARRLTHLPQREYEPSIELWFDAQRAYVPVRMRVTLANGDYVDQLWAGEAAP